MTKLKLTATGPNVEPFEYIYKELNDYPNGYIEGLRGKGYNKIRLELVDE